VAADLIIYAVIAAGLVMYLRNILGTRTGDERQRPNPFAQKPELGNNPEGAAGAAIKAPLKNVPVTPHDNLERHMHVSGVLAQQGLMDIMRADRDFSVATFLRGAQDAFVMIVEAFARDDRETLRDLCAPHIYQAFDQAMRTREQSGQTMQVEIHAVRKVDVLEARYDGHEAVISIRFIADETSVLRDAEGQFISGHPDRVTETNDIWTFTRVLKSRDPIWYLSQTREGEGDEQAGSTVPETHI
jgi:predicted lipid-binding transport protein (Tim44 family)